MKNILNNNYCYIYIYLLFSLFLFFSNNCTLKLSSLEFILLSYLLLSSGLLTKRKR